MKPLCDPSGDSYSDEDEWEEDSDDPDDPEYKSPKKSSYHLRKRPPIVVKLRKSQSQKNKEYYEKRKHLYTMNPELRESRARKMRLYRASWDPDRKAAERDKSKIRMRKSRERRKEQHQPTSRKKTRKEIENQRKQWREAKQRSRSKQSTEKKEAIRAKNRERYRERHASKLTSKRKLEFEKNVAESYKAEDYAELVDNLLQKASPKKKRALLKRGIRSPHNCSLERRIVSNIELSIKDIKSDGSKQGRSKYNFLVRSVKKKSGDAAIRKRLQISKYFWYHASQLDEMNVKNVTHKNRMRDSDIKLVRNFYYNNATSFAETEKAGKCALDRSVASLYEKFISEENCVISKSKFHQLRPKDVVTIDKVKFETCLCEYCINVEFVVRALAQIKRRATTDGNRINLGIEFKNKYDVVNATLCDKGASVYHKYDCIKRNCGVCGVEHFRNILKPMQDVVGVYTWKKWVNATVSDSKRKVLKECNGTAKDVIEDLCSQMKEFGIHLFNAKWQSDCFKQIIAKVPENKLISVMDFSENYRCVTQDEAASAYYAYNQVTIHPYICYYNCGESDCTSIVQETFVCITDDTKHDSFAVDIFTKKIEEDLQSHGVNYDYHIQWTDGCGIQYKSKSPFHDISLKSNFERNFFGSRHGKNPCDPVGGVIKKQAQSFVKGGRGLIRNAEEFFTFCEQNLTRTSSKKCVHKRRKFFYFTNFRESEKPKEKLYTLRGTHQIHKVGSVGRPGVVSFSNLSCFCEGCLGDGVCRNRSYVKPNDEMDLTKPMKAMKRKSKETKNENHKNARERKKIKVKQEPTKNESNNSNPKKNAAKEHSNPVYNFLVNHCEWRRRVSTRITFADIAKLKITPIEPSKELDLSIIGLKKNIDAYSLELRPDDNYLWPCNVYADGNCLPRCGSLALYGTEDHHASLRVRIAHELAKNESFYTNNEKMSRGKNEKGNDNVITSMLLVSQYFKADENVEDSVHDIYKREAEGSIKNGEYMGAFQLAAMASVIGRPINAVYPQYAGHILRKEMERTYYPREESAARPIHILWSHVQGKHIKESRWSPNHFVLLLPMTNFIRRTPVKIHKESTPDVDKAHKCQVDFDSEFTSFQKHCAGLEDISEFTSDFQVNNAGDQPHPTPKEASMNKSKCKDKGEKVPMPTNSSSNENFDVNYFEALQDADVISSQASSTETSDVSHIPHIREEQIFTEDEHPFTDSTDVAGQRMLHSTTEDEKSSQPQLDPTTEKAEQIPSQDEDVSSMDDEDEKSSQPQLDPTTEKAEQIPSQDERVSGTDDEDEKFSQPDLYSTIEKAEQTPSQDKDEKSSQPQLDPTTEKADQISSQDEDVSSTDDEDEKFSQPDLYSTKEKGEQTPSQDEDEKSSQPQLNPTTEKAEQILSQDEDVSSTDDEDEKSSQSKLVPTISYSYAGQRTKTVLNRIIETLASDESEEDISRDVLEPKCSDILEPKCSDIMEPKGRDVLEQKGNDKGSDEDIRPGTNLLIQHGRESLPAVVQNWPWVCFYARKGKTDLWAENDIQHTIGKMDIIKVLHPPDISLSGCRVYYKFNEKWQ